MDEIWGRAWKLVEDRRARGDFRDSIIDMKLNEYEKSGFPTSQQYFNNLFGEIFEARADSKFPSILNFKRCTICGFLIEP